jgi:hypothetical protein
MFDFLHTWARARQSKEWDAVTITTQGVRTWNSVHKFAHRVDSILDHLHRIERDNRIEASKRYNQEPPKGDEQHIETRRWGSICAKSNSGSPTSAVSSIQLPRR